MHIRRDCTSSLMAWQGGGNHTAVMPASAIASALSASICSQAGRRLWSRMVWHSQLKPYSSGVPFRYGLQRFRPQPFFPCALLRQTRRASGHGNIKVLWEPTVAELDRHQQAAVLLQ